MRYLFFDIECSEGKSMCSFGYVLTDEKFRILEKDDILMNPEAIFHTGAWGKKNREAYPGIEMASGCLGLLVATAITRATAARI